jgi:hypothetical protein
MMDASIRDNLTLPSIESLGGAMGPRRRPHRASGAGPARDGAAQGAGLARQPVRALSGGQPAEGGDRQVASPRRRRSSSWTSPRAAWTWARGPRSMPSPTGSRPRGRGSSSSPRARRAHGLCDRIAVMSRGEVVAPTTARLRGAAHHRQRLPPDPAQGEAA